MEGFQNPVDGFLTNVRWDQEIQVFLIEDKTKGETYKHFADVRVDRDSPVEILMSPASTFIGLVDSKEGHVGKIAMVFDATG